MRIRKWLLLILMAMNIPVPGNAQRSNSQTALIARKDKEQFISLGSKLHQLEKQYNATIFYKSSEVRGKYVANNQQKESDLEASLMRFLEPLNMKYRKLTSNSFVIFKKENKEVRQQKVQGTVTDRSGTALPGVNISVKGTTIGTFTDKKGAFELTVPSLNDTLSFSFVGYQTKEVAINGRKNLGEIKLKAKL